MRSIPLWLATMLLAGCATVHPSAQSGPAAGWPPAAQTAAGASVAASDPLASAATQPARDVLTGAKPARSTARTVEEWSAELAAAITRLRNDPTSGREVELAQAFVRAGILDKAYDHFAAAARLDPNEGAAWDGLARIWRDWGYPQYALGHAYRGVHAAPRSPATRNTLGTILHNLGRYRDARTQFAEALALDPGAAYASNNICYSWMMEANTDAAAAACGKALALDPSLVPARNNLALVRAIDGDLRVARRLLEQAGGEVSAQYNLGIILLSRQRYAEAADAFERAALRQPAPALAAARARQARQLAVDALGSERKP